MSMAQIVLIALAVAAAGDAILAKLWLGARDDRIRVESQFASFKAQVRAEGERAEQAAKAKAVADRKAKGEADAENARTASRNAAAIAELRHQRDSARSAFLSAAPAAPGGADVACFGRPDFERAYGNLVQELRGIADEGTKAVTDLDTGKAWAQRSSTQ